jgi:hypothetical protein
MKADNTSTDHNRTIRLTEVPGDVPELLITVGYVQTNVPVAITLDKVVIPAIIEALNRPLGSVERRDAVDPNFDVWGQDDRFPRADWKFEVADGATGLGYWEWVDHQIEANQD